MGRFQMEKGAPGAEEIQDPHFESKSFGWESVERCWLSEGFVQHGCLRSEESQHPLG